MRKLRGGEVVQGIVCVLLFMCFASCLVRLGRDAHNERHEERQQPTEQPRILCAILTVENSTKIEAVERTWAKRCDKFLKVIQGPQLEETEHWLHVPLKRESRNELWHKIIGTFTYLYEHKLDQFDWFLKADDDTYFLMDNLRHFLANRSAQPSEPIHFGHRFKPMVKQGYMSGGSGYIMSREALRRLNERGFSKNLTACNLSKGFVEDVEMGKCLEAVQVEAGDTRDSLGRESFLPLAPQALLSEHKPEMWYWKYNYYSAEFKKEPPFKDCCSNRPISFHYITPRDMYLIDWLLYDVEHKNEQQSKE